MSNRQDVGYPPAPLLFPSTACSLQTMLLTTFATVGNWRTISRVIAEVRIIVTTAAAQWGHAVQFACQSAATTALGFRSRKTQRTSEKLAEVFSEPRIRASIRPRPMLEDVEGFRRMNDVPYGH